MEKDRWRLKGKKKVHSEKDLWVSGKEILNISIPSSLGKEVPNLEVVLLTAKYPVSHISET